MIESMKFPVGFQLPAGTKAVTLTFGDGDKAVKILAEGDYKYLLCNEDFVSWGKLMSFNEVRAKIEKDGLGC